MYARDHGGIATPIGRVTVAASGDHLLSIRIGDEQGPSSDAALVRDACLQLEQWFAGERRDFDLPLARAATPRGNDLRAAMVAVGYGKTVSYGTLAARITSSPRAIGQACARNPFPIVVPCHRVLAARGVLGAYSAGDGPTTKAWLLNHERIHAGEPA